MNLHESIALIKNGVAANTSPQIWADLGAGKGLFSHALLSILPAGSTVHAVDIEQQDFHDYPPSVTFHLGNFASDELQLPALDGILLANSLHYVKDQVSCIKRLRRYLKHDAGKFMLIEYDTDQPNRWVPYPLSFLRAQQLFQQAGFSTVKKIGEHPSIYRRDPIYAALIGAAKRHD